MSDYISRAFMKSLGAKCIAVRDEKTNELIAITGIDELPSADVQPVRWIPCSERLPDIKDIYIVLVNENQLRPNESRVACAYWLDDKWQYDVLESYEHKMPKLVIEPLEELTVVAWMPLPEPYQGKRKGAEDGN